MRVDWRKLIPPRGGWPRLLASPSSVLLFVGLAATIHAKARVLVAIDDLSAWPVALLWAMGWDVFVYSAFAAVFAVAEARSPWMRAITVPLAALIAVVALANSWYVSVAGEQLDWATVQLGFDRVTDVLAIAGEAVIANHTTALLVVLLLAVAPLLIRWQLRIRSGPWRQPEHAHTRAHCAAGAAVAGLLLIVACPSPSSLPAQRLGGNAALGTYWGWIQDDGTDTLALVEFEGYQVPYMVTDAELERLRGLPNRPNVLLIVLESTRFDHTSLASGPQWRGTETPHLVALARGGASAVNARAVLPHTTKSLFSILCGRFPMMQALTVEFSANFEAQCVPEILAAAGYRTAFLQGAWGGFEERVRLVDRLGYEHFEAWEDIQGESVGYISSDDLSLVQPLADWLDAAPEDAGPFFATILTSAAHHPYRLPSTLPPNGASTEEERYARIVEAEDLMVGRMVEVLEQRGLRDRTVVIVLGDHGEGFGAKGTRQHDGNFYEEGLKVPLVFNGPGVPVGAIDSNVSLADVAPTLLGLVGARIAPEAQPHLEGIDLFAGPIPKRTLLFSCWWELRCRGFVHGNDKIVYVPDTGRAYHFDLARDPDESDPGPVPARYRQWLPMLDHALDSHRTRRWPIVLGATRSYGRWRCEAGTPCTHPNQQPLTMKW